MQYYLSKEEFQRHLNDSKVTRQDKVLLILFWDKESSKSPSEITKVAMENGLRESSKWNISDILRRSKGKAILTDNKWVLTISGREHLIASNYIVKATAQLHLKNDISDLQKLLSKVANLDTKHFLEEAILCLQGDLKRAAVVLSWVGAVSILYDEVVLNHLIDFNNEATKRDAKWKPAKNADDLAKMKEFDFLNILEAISMIGKNVKQELQQCLQLRNGCGHPNTLKIGLRKVAAHIEILILNVFSKY